MSARILRQLPVSARLVSRSTAVGLSAKRLPLVASRVAQPAVRAFSVSARSLGQGTSDVALVQKLEEELQYETNEISRDEPEFLKSFKELGVWTIEDKPGQDEVGLTRTFGNENIKILFSIADVQNDPEDDFEDEEGKEEEAESENEKDEEVLHTFPIRTSLSLTKTSVPGSLNVDMVCQEGSFIIESVTFYNDSKIGTELSAEADWVRRGLYIGPQFESLDVTLQENFEQFLQERGVNEAVALFIPEYAEFKEQKEYVQWLKNVKRFTEA